MSLSLHTTKTVGALYLHGLALSIFGLVIGIRNDFFFNNAEPYTVTSL